MQKKELNRYNNLMSVGYKIKNILWKRPIAFSGFIDTETIFIITFILIILIPLGISLYYSDYISYFKYSKDFDNPHKEINVSRDPIQILNVFCYIPMLESGCNGEYKTIVVNNYTISPVASYKIAGLVVAKNTTFSDPMSNIMPIDIGIAWGKNGRTSI